MDCSHSDCSRPPHVRGLCGMHYMRDKRGQAMDAPSRLDRPTVCTVDGCERAHFGVGFCAAHLRRLRKVGDVQADRPLRQDAATQFWTYVGTGDLVPGRPDLGPCEPWTGSVSKSGYGVAADGAGGSVGAHRRRLILDGVDIPYGYFVDHLCHDPLTCTVPAALCPHRRCVARLHLEPVTPHENWRRGAIGAGLAELRRLGLDVTALANAV